LRRLEEEMMLLPRKNTINAPIGALIVFFGFYC
jgi:hypothetical protein